MTPQLQLLLPSGIGVLFYPGNLSLACNTAGNTRWAEGKGWKGRLEFTAKVVQEVEVGR